MVNSIPFVDKISAAFLHSSNRAPRLMMAACFPDLTTLPFPISNVSLISGSSMPTPFPLGYLNAQGRSLILTAVLTILTSSDSSLAAITTKLGKVDKYVTSNEPACVGPSAPTKPARSIANLTGND